MREREKAETNGKGGDTGPDQPYIPQGYTLALSRLATVIVELELPVKSCVNPPAAPRLTS